MAINFRLLPVIGNFAYYVLDGDSFGDPAQTASSAVFPATADWPTDGKRLGKIEEASVDFSFQGEAQHYAPDANSGTYTPVATTYETTELILNLNLLEMDEFLMRLAFGGTDPDASGIYTPGGIKAKPVGWLHLIQHIKGDDKKGHFATLWGEFEVSDGRTYGRQPTKPVVRFRRLANALNTATVDFSAAT